MDGDIIQRARLVATDLVRQLNVAEQQRGHDGDEARFQDAITVALDAAMDRLREIDVWGPANRMASNEFWRIAEPWLEHGELQVHARTKPRGYAGDFELLRKICYQIAVQHPLGGACDRYFLQEAAPAAVRCRTELVTQRLIRRSELMSSQPLRIVSVGSGPAIELQQAVERLPESARQRVRITLLDLDQQALDYASDQLTPLLDSCGLHAIRANLARLPGNPKLLTAISPADYLFCPGFFDYLDDAAAVAMLKLFFRALAPGGELTVFNFSPSNTSRAYMEWIGNWYLTYRDEKAMGRLANQLGEVACVDVRSISEGTLVELTIRRADACPAIIQTDGGPSGPV